MYPIVKKLAALFALLCIISIILTLSHATQPETIPPIVKNSAQHSQIYVSNHGWHTGIILKASDLFTQIPELNSRFNDDDFLEIGWGDAGFYQAEKISAQLAVKALFWPTNSVMHLVGFSSQPQHYFPSSAIKPVTIATENMATLLQYIHSSFALNNTGQVIAQQIGLYGNSQFYQGHGSYYAFNTCNKWTAKALSSAGLNINPLFKLTAASVTDTL